MKQVLFCVLIITMFILAGCKSEIKSEEVSEKDCGEDIQCYMNSLKACSPAGLYALPQEGWFSQMRILGFEGDNCKVEFKDTNVNKEDKTIRTSMCKIPKNDLSKITEEEMFGGYQFTEKCIEHIVISKIQIEQNVEEEPEHCYNTIKDENEEGIDCGGGCIACAQLVCNANNMCEPEIGEDSSICPKDCQ